MPLLKLLFSFNGKNLSALFAALILSMNGIRYLLSLQESNIIIYGVYVVFIVSSCVFFRQNFKNLCRIQLVLVLGFIFVLLGIVTSPFGDSSDMLGGFKLLLILLTALAFFLQDSNSIRLTINLTYLLTFIYIIMIVANPQKINIYLSKGSNYLVLALPIGFVLSMLLPRIVFKIYTKVNVSKFIVEIIASVTAFVALINLSGRGSILFPFLVTIFFAFLLEPKKILKKLGILVAFALVIYLGYQFFIQYANEYTVGRMFRLFKDSGNEDRWTIWRIYVDYIWNGEKWISGGGTGSSVRNLGFYPHNLFLQSVGEFGLIGFAFCLYTCIVVVVIQVKSFICFRGSESIKILFVELSAGLLYLFLNFMKSFQIYDSTPLLMITFGLVSIYYTRLEKYNGKILG